MKVTSALLEPLHLDKQHLLLSARAVQMLKSYFDLVDVRKQSALDDIQFLAVMKSFTDLREAQIYRVFDMFDVDDSGTIEFDEFYLLVCMLVAIKDREEKQFLWHHSRTCFELLDEGKQIVVFLG